MAFTRMNSILRTIAIVIVTLATPTQLALASDIKIEDLMNDAGLTEIPLEKLSNCQHFENPYFVASTDGKVTIQKAIPPSTSKKFEESGILYTGTNNGEWGGTLTVTQNGSTKVLMEGNIVQLTPVLDGLYVFEGLAHLGSSRGSVHIIHNRNKPNTPEKLTLLPDAPIVITQDKSRLDYQPILIVGNKGIMRVLPSPFEALEILYWDAFWSHKMKPTSIAKYGNSYLVGLPHGVAVIQANSKKARFFAEKLLIDESEAR